jgi:hypothetical protein
MATNCQSLKTTLLEFLGSAIDVTETRDYCVLTLPQKTIDDRHAAVFVHEKVPGYFLVHDGGKTAAELFAQGIHVTDLMQGALEDLAERYGATFVQGTFRIGCRAENLNTAIVAIAQCATLGTWYVLGHKPRFEEEPILHRVEAGLRAWQAPYETDIRERVHVHGQKGEHVIDFVSFPRNVPRNPIGVKVVRPSDNPLGQARGYGFMAYDLQNTQYATWPRVAVVTRAEEWTDESLDLVRASATTTVAVETGNEEAIEQRLQEQLTEVAA